MTESKSRRPSLDVPDILATVGMGLIVVGVAAALGAPAGIITAGLGLVVVALIVTFARRA